MTPFLLFILLTIILKGIFIPIEAVSVVATKQFSIGFLEGYHTMDALSPMVLAGMIISNLREKGIESKVTLTRYTIYTEIIAAIGLTFVYGGLIFLGAKLSPVLPNDLGRTELLNTIVHYLLGGYGSISLSIMVTLTSIGLITATGDFFIKVSNGKLRYQYVVIVAVIVSAILSVMGVEGIIDFSVPILVSIYPVVIVLTFLNLFDEYIKDDLVYKTSAYFTLAVGLISGIEALGFKDLGIVKLFSKLPLWEVGFGWILFAFIGLIIGIIISKFNVGTERK